MVHLCADGPLRPFLPALPLPLGFACFFACLPLVPRSLLLTRALRVYPAPLCAMPALPSLGGAPLAPFCLYYAPSLPLLFIHPSIPVVGFTYTLPLCPYVFPWSWIVPSPSSLSRFFFHKLLATSLIPDASLNRAAKGIRRMSFTMQTG